jgi:hypothetical protein
MSRSKQAYCEFDGSDVPDMDDLIPDEPSRFEMTRTIPEHIALELAWLDESTAFPSHYQREWVRTFLVQPPCHRLSPFIRSLDARVAA